MRLIAFGPHVHKQRLDDAVAAGVDEAVSRGELFGGFPALFVVGFTFTRRFLNDGSLIMHQPAHQGQSHQVQLRQRFV